MKHNKEVKKCEIVSMSDVIVNGEGNSIEYRD